MNRRLKMMVSSTVYGIEDMLDQIYAFLHAAGFEVWMSHVGTVTIYPTMTALDNCLQAVNDCDLFLAVITTRYGSGVLPGELGITHQELLKAIQLEKPRWILAHEHVVFARTLFDKLGCKSAKDRDAMLAKIGFDDDRKLKSLQKKHERVIDDFRVIDMYDAAARHDIQVYHDRQGNWVQKFRSADDGLLFATAQFGRYREIESFLKEHLASDQAVRDELARRPKP